MNINFTVFIDKILSGEKRQTIRRAGKKWANVKVGDKLTLYTGLRTKQCRKLGEAEIEEILDVRIVTSILNVCYVFVNDTLIRRKELEKLARKDGFDSGIAFCKWFFDKYGDDFHGKVIRWKNFITQKEEE